MKKKNHSKTFLIIVIILSVLILFSMLTLATIFSFTNLRETKLWELLSSSKGIFIGLLVSIISNILSSVLFSKGLSTRINSLLQFILGRLNSTTQIIQDRLQKTVQNLVSVETQASRMSIILSKALYNSGSTLVIGFRNSIQILESMINILVNKLRGPKWYHNNENAIDPGLIEVSLAVTAVLIALPTYIEPRITAEQASLFNTFRFIGEAIPTITSIGLLNRYAKNKGAKSIHILLSPIEDGPFFFLGWSIVIGFVLIAIVFQLN